MTRFNVNAASVSFGSFRSIRSTVLLISDLRAERYDDIVFYGFVFSIVYSGAPNHRASDRYRATKKQ